MQQYASSSNQQWCAHGSTTWYSSHADRDTSQAWKGLQSPSGHLGAANMSYASMEDTCPGRSSSRQDHSMAMTASQANPSHSSLLSTLGSDMGAGVHLPGAGRDPMMMGSYGSQPYGSGGSSSYPGLAGPRSGRLGDPENGQINEQRGHGMIPQPQQHGLSDAGRSVEDLLKWIISMPPTADILSLLAPSLQHLDSSALAALMKELGRNGMTPRAVEVFDYLRASGLQQHSHLLDIYTYTTAISICSSTQQLQRALELMAEMRARGITCNVHTYSALMNVCIKCNEVALVQEVYQQMLAEGCTPNLVTYNTLIDLYVKTGQWREAIKLLDALEEKGIQPEVRTYNTIITACNKSGQPDEGLGVYDRMMAAGVAPSATTYTALISAYGKQGRVDKALAVFADMVARGCERNVITFSSLISAAEKAGRPDLALQLWDTMHAEGCRPNVVTYNSLIAACAHGGQWEKASELFGQLLREGLSPDAITYSALISALERGGRWRHALLTFHQMTRAGCHPDGMVYNTLLEACWASGVLPAQMRAAHIWSLANRSGHFRIYAQAKGGPGVLQHSCAVLTCGAAVVTLLRWLSDLKHKVQQEGVAALRSRVVFLFQKGKRSRLEAAPGAIAAALRYLLEGHSAPFAVSVTDKGTALEAGSGPLVAWLRSPAYGPLAHLVAPGGGGKRLPLDALLASDEALEARCHEAWGLVTSCEALRAQQVTQAQGGGSAPPSQPGSCGAYTTPSLLASGSPAGSGGQGLAGACEGGSSSSLGGYSQGATPGSSGGVCLPAELSTQEQRQRVLDYTLRVAASLGWRADVCYDALDLLQRVLPPGRRTPAGGAATSSASSSQTVGSWDNGARGGGGMGSPGGGGGGVAGSTGSLDYHNGMGGSGSVAAANSLSAAVAATSNNGVGMAVGGGSLSSPGSSHSSGGALGGAGEAAAAGGGSGGSGGASGLGAGLQQQVLGCLMVAARQGELAGRLLPLELLSAATGLSVDVLVGCERAALGVLGHDVGAISALRCCHLLLERLGVGHGEAGALAAQTQELHALVHLAACSPALAHLPPSLTAAALVVHLRRRACSSPPWPSALATMTGLADPGVAPLTEAVAGVEVLLQGVAAQQAAARARQHQQQQQMAAAAAVAAMQEAAGLSQQHVAPGGARNFAMPLTIAGAGAGSSGAGSSSSGGRAGVWYNTYGGGSSSGMLANGSLDQGLLAGGSAPPQVGLDVGSAGGGGGLLQAASADSLLGSYLAQSLAVSPGLNYMLNQQALGDQMKQLEEAMGRRLL